MTQIVKVDSNGNKIWYKLYSTDKNLTWGKCIAETKEGGFVIGGEVGDEWSSNFNLTGQSYEKYEATGHLIS